MLRIVSLRNLCLVDESINPSGSFKWRGILPQVARLRNAARRKSSGQVVTFSSGNHGLAVALAARQCGLRAIVVVPQWVERDKLNLLTKMGCRVVFGGSSALKCEAVAHQWAGATESVLIHPFRNREQIAGYTSLWAELARIFPEGADIAVPVGAGGLIAAGVLYRIAVGARYHLIGVEPDLCATLGAALGEGKSETLATRSLYAPGLNVNETPREVLELVAKADCLDLVRVSDQEMAAASSIMALAGMVIDPAAAAAVAGALFRSVRRQYRKFVVIITGRGAAVSAERLRQEGLLTLDDRELASLVLSHSPAAGTVIRDVVRPLCPLTTANR